MANNEDILKPFQYGWKRELVMSYQAKNRLRTCVYYRTPEGKRLRSGPEIQDYLKDKNIVVLTKEQFTFTTSTIYKEPFELQIWVDPNCKRIKSSRKSVESTKPSTVKTSPSSSSSPTRPSLHPTSHPSVSYPPNLTPSVIPANSPARLINPTTHQSASAPRPPPTHVPENRASAVQTICPRQQLIRTSIPGIVPPQHFFQTVPRIFPQPNLTQRPIAFFPHTPNLTAPFVPGYVPVPHPSQINSLRLSPHHTAVAHRPNILQPSVTGGNISVLRLDQINFHRPSRSQTIVSHRTNLSQPSVSGGNISIPTLNPIDFPRPSLCQTLSHRPYLQQTSVAVVSPRPFNPTASSVSSNTTSEPSLTSLTSSAMSEKAPGQGHLQQVLMSTLSSPKTFQTGRDQASTSSNARRIESVSNEVTRSESSRYGDATDPAPVTKPVSPDSTVVKTEPEGDSTMVRDPVMETLSMGGVCKSEPGEEDVKPIKEEPNCYTVDQIAMMKAYGIEMQQNMFVVKEEQDEKPEGTSTVVERASSDSTRSRAVRRENTTQGDSGTRPQDTTREKTSTQSPHTVVPQILLENKSRRSASNTASGVYIDVAEDPLMSRQAKDFYGLTDDQATEHGGSSDSSSPEHSDTEGVSASSQTPGSSKGNLSSKLNCQLGTQKVLGGSKKRTPAQERIWKSMAQNKKGVKKAATVVKKGASAGKKSVSAPRPKPTEDEEVYICHLCTQSFTGYNAEPDMRRHLWSKHHVYSCNCGETFKKKEQLEEHEQTCTGEVTFYKCAECSEASFQSVDDVKQHMEKKHPRGGNKKVNIDMGWFCQPKKKPSSFKCRQCSAKPFDTTTAYKNHLSAKHSIPPNQVCDVCDKVFSKEFSTNLHMLSLHLRGSPFICDKCYKVFFRYSPFMSHTCDTDTAGQSAEVLVAPPASQSQQQQQVQQKSGVSSDGQEAGDKEPMFRCFGCGGRIFSNVYNLLSHIKGKHPKATPHMTCACGKRVNSVQAMHKHRQQCAQKGRKHAQNETTEEETKDSEPEHECPFCEKTFWSLSSVRKHVTLMHKEQDDNSSETDHACTMCDKTFSIGSSLKKHVTLAHKKENDNGSETDHTCTVCNKTFGSGSSLKKHVTLMHKKEDDNGSEPEHTCTVCDKTFGSGSSLKKHVTLVHKKEDENGSEPELVCTVCDKTFSSGSSMKKHITVMHTKEGQTVGKGQIKLKCKICEKKFTSEVAHKKHMSLYHKEKNYRCACGLQFQTYGGLYKHKLMCKGGATKKYLASSSRRSIKQACKCHVCTKPFSNIGNLKRHMRIVHRLKDVRLPCSCGEKFDTLRDLINHAKVCKVKTEEKNDLRCSVCGKEFTQPMNMRRHMLSQHGLGNRMICFCGEKFIHQAVYYNHIKLCNKKEQKCDVCQRLFRSSTRLLSHQREKHGRTDEPTELSPVTPPVTALTCGCGKTFSGQSQLSSHKKTCFVKPSKCHICTKVLIYPWNMTRHMLEVHHIGKKLTCSCGERFTRHITLSRHKQTCGSKQAPSAAEKQESRGDPEKMLCGCGKQFTYRVRYNLHVRRCETMRKVTTEQEEATEEAEEEEKSSEGTSSSSRTSSTSSSSNGDSNSPTQKKTCQHCKMRFLHDSSLEEHLWAVHKIGKPLKCKACKKQFRYKRNLSEHQKDCCKKKGKSKELATLLTDAANSFKSTDEKAAIGRRKAAVVGKAKLKKCINREASTNQDGYESDGIDYMDYDDVDQSSGSEQKTSSSVTGSGSTAGSSSDAENGGLSKEDIEQLFKNVNLQKLCLKPYVRCERLTQRVIRRWVKYQKAEEEIIPAEKMSRSSQMSKSGKKITFRQTPKIPPTKGKVSLPVSQNAEGNKLSDNEDLPAAAPAEVESDSSYGTADKIDIVDDSDSETEKTVTKKEVVQLSDRAVSFTLPIRLYRSLNKCSHPETRTLYIGTSTRNEWIKVVGKTRDTFLYQCYYCTEARQEPKQVATHMTGNHSDLKELVQMSNTTKSSMFISCRHCDFISMQSKLFWYHFKYEHGVGQVLVPEAAVPDVDIYRNQSATAVKNVDNSCQYQCAVQLCEFTTSEDKDIVCHMFECHRYSDHIKEGFIRTLRSRSGTVPDERDEAYMCTICRFVAYQAFLMDLHCFESHAQKFLLYVCDTCGEQFIPYSVGVLEAHMKEKHQQIKVKVSVTLIDSSGVEDEALCSQRPQSKKRKKSLKEQQVSRKVRRIEPVVKAPPQKYRPGPLSFKKRTMTPTVDLSPSEGSECVSGQRGTPNSLKPMSKTTSEANGKSSDRSEAVTSTTNWGEAQSSKRRASVSTATGKDSLDLPDITCKRRQRPEAVVGSGPLPWLQARKSIGCGGDMPLSMDCEDEEGNTVGQEKLISIRPVNQTTDISVGGAPGSQLARQNVEGATSSTTVQSGQISGSSEVRTGNQTKDRDQVPVVRPPVRQFPGEIVISDSDDDDVEIIKVDPKKTTVLAVGGAPQNQTPSFVFSKQRPPQLATNSAPKAPFGRHQISWQMGSQPQVQQVQPLVRMPAVTSSSSTQKQVLGPSPTVQHVLGGSFPSSTPLVMQITQPPQATTSTAGGVQQLSSGGSQVIAQSILSTSSNNTLGPQNANGSTVIMGGNPSLNAVVGNPSAVGVPAQRPIISNVSNSPGPDVNLGCLVSQTPPPVTLQGLCLVNIPPGGSLADISKLQIHPLVPTQPVMATAQTQLASSSSSADISRVAEQLGASHTPVIGSIALASTAGPPQVSRMPRLGEGQPTATQPALVQNPTNQATAIQPTPAYVQDTVWTTQSAPTYVVQNPVVPPSTSQPTPAYVQNPIYQPTESQPPPANVQKIPSRNTVRKILELNQNTPSMSASPPHTVQTGGVATGVDRPQYVASPLLQQVLTASTSQSFTATPPLSTVIPLPPTVIQPVYPTNSQPAPCITQPRGTVTPPPPPPPTTGSPSRIPYDPSKRYDRTTTTSEQPRTAVSSPRALTVRQILAINQNTPPPVSTSPPQGEGTTAEPGTVREILTINRNTPPPVSTSPSQGEGTRGEPGTVREILAVNQNTPPPVSSSPAGEPCVQREEGNTSIATNNSSIITTGESFLATNGSSLATDGSSSIATVHPQQNLTAAVNSVGTHQITGVNPLDSTVATAQDPLPQMTQQTTESQIQKIVANTDPQSATESVIAATHLSTKPQKQPCTEGHEQMRSFSGAFEKFLNKDS